MRFRRVRRVRRSYVLVVCNKNNNIDRLCGLNAKKKIGKTFPIARDSREEKKIFIFKRTSFKIRFLYGDFI